MEPNVHVHTIASCLKEIKSNKIIYVCVCVFAHIDKLCHQRTNRHRRLISPIAKCTDAEPPFGLVKTKQIIFFKYKIK